MLFNYRKKLINLNQTKMRTNNLYKIFVLLICLSFTLCGFSQSRGLCGTYKIDTAALKKAKEFENNNRLNNSIQSTSFTIRVYFHILNCNDGSFSAATPAQITTEFNTLTAAYSSNNICFINAGYDNIYNSILDTNFNVNTSDPSLFNYYRVPNCINVFYPYKIKGTNSACSGTCGIGGISFSIPSTFCLVSRTNIAAAQTVAHEVGHCMGLLHTFDHSNGYEDINGSNSSTAGDLVTDTQADPYGYIGQNCYSTSSNGCTYTGYCTDPNGANNFSPPYSNLMTYWWAGNSITCYSSLALTNGQYIRVNSYLNTNSDLISCESPPSVTESGVSISSGYLMASAINTLSTSGTVSITGTAISLLGGNTVILEPGFDANPLAGGSTLIRLSQCSGAANFAIAEKLKSFSDDAANTLIAYPNPTSSTIHLAIKLVHNENKISVRVYDINMKAVKEISLENLLKGNNMVDIDLSKFSSGMYAVTMQGTDVLMRALIVLQK